jgi:L-aspartate oxidase
VKTKEILVVGAGIAGCAVALALAKRGIGVTIMTSLIDQRVYPPFIQRDSLQETVHALQKERQDQMSCSRAHEQLAALAGKSIEELLEPNFLVDRNGNIDIHRCLQEQLKQQPHVEWISHHSVVELLMLDQHSMKKADRYKKPACVGVIAYDHDAQRIEYFLAKEIILATGGAPSLFPYSSHPSTACGEGISIAYRAGARLLNLEQIQFHSLGLYEKDRPCFPLPLDLLTVGGKIHAVKTVPLELDFSQSYLIPQLYEQLLKTHSEHLWLDLTLVDTDALKEKFPSVDAYCLHHGFNIAKDVLPIVPIACYTCGGVAVDRVAQTTIQRLRAIGEVSCTGLFWNFKEESLSVLESLTWAISCAEDIAKQATKLVYYFPEVREGVIHLGTSSTVVEEDWKLLRHIMWSYLGIKNDVTHLERGMALLQQLYLVNTPHDVSSCSIEQIQLFYAIQTALLIGHFARVQHGILTIHASHFHSLFQRVGVEKASTYSHFPRKQEKLTSSLN